MKFAIASDHAGYDYKARLAKELSGLGYDFIDLGTNSAEPVDYPAIAQKMAEAIRNGQVERGILICGSGVGVSIAANKFPGMRAGVCHDTYSAHQGVEHDNMNILCVGERVVGFQLVKEIALAFIQARFSEEERHKRRVNEIMKIEKKYMK